MQIIPPELLPYSTVDYYGDIEYREQADLEARAECQLRLVLLFNPEVEEIVDY